MKKSLSFLIILTFCFIGHSQVKEYGIFAGGVYYIGDINREHFSQQQVSLGGVYKKDFPNNRVSLRYHLMYNQLKANDFKSGIADQINRNLSFKNDIIEFGPIIEFDFFTFQPGQNDPEQGSFGTPYFFAGINFMRMNPKAKTDDGEWVALRDLATEGQGTRFNPTQKIYSLNQIVIPFGIGIKVNFSHHTSLCFEYGIRKTFSDYLDDVSGLYPNIPEYRIENLQAAQMSDRAKFKHGINGTSSYGLQRGNSADKDWYMVSGIVLTYELFSDSSCPKW